MTIPLLLGTAIVTASLPVVSAADLAVPVGGSIQATIDLASSGDRILVPPGVYPQRLDTRGKAIEIVGLHGPAFTIVDAVFQGRVLTMLNGEGPGTVVRGLTLTRGEGGTGPGGVVTNSAPRLQDCVITRNSGRRGAGVFGNPTLVSCEISNNSSTLNHGGGIFAFGATRLSRCTVVGNHLATCSQIGGGVYGAVTLVDSIAWGNEASQLEGGAVARYSDVQGAFPGPGNNDGDPMSWNVADGDVHLRAGSPCIDSGNPTSPPDPNGSFADMGAYPFDPAYFSVPFNYCDSTPNSTGLAARVHFSGSTSLLANDLVLMAEDCAPQQFGLFVIGASPALRSEPCPSERALPLRRWRTATLALGASSADSPSSRPTAAAERGLRSTTRQRLLVRR